MKHVPSKPAWIANDIKVFKDNGPLGPAYTVTHNGKNVVTCGGGADNGKSRAIKSADDLAASLGVD